MLGRMFLHVARDCVVHGTEQHWRGAAIHAYYALFLECRDLLFQWGLRLPRRDNVHAWVRLRLTYSRENDLKQIGFRLDELVRLRNDASYDMRILAEFADNTRAVNVITDATAAIALIDQIDSDPSRRAAAIASLPP